MGFFDQLLGAAGGPIGALVSGGLSYLGGEQTNKQAQQNQQSQFFDNLALQQQAEQFNAQQNATKYQTAVADMRKAGLNPILAAGGVSATGASIGGGSVGAAPVVNALGGAVSSAQQGSKISTELEQINAAIKQSVAQSDKIQSETQGQQIENQLKQPIAQSIINNNEASARNNTAQAAAAAQSAGLTELTKSLTSTYGRSPGILSPETLSLGGKNLIEVVRHASDKMGTIGEAVQKVKSLMSSPTQ